MLCITVFTNNFNSGIVCKLLKGLNTLKTLKNPKLVPSVLASSIANETKPEVYSNSWISGRFKFNDEYLWCKFCCKFSQPMNNNLWSLWYFLKPQYWNSWFPSRPYSKWRIMKGLIQIDPRSLAFNEDAKKLLSTKVFNSF